MRESEYTETDFSLTPLSSGVGEILVSLYTNYVRKPHHYPEVLC